MSSNPCWTSSLVILPDTGWGGDLASNTWYQYFLFYKENTGISHVVLIILLLFNNNNNSFFIYLIFFIVIFLQDVLCLPRPPNPPIVALESAAQTW